MTFRLQRYAEWLRDRCAARVENWPELVDEPRLLVIGKTAFLNEIAYLLARGLLDARFDSLLIPILVRTASGDLAATLESQDWGLPAGFWQARLGDGACILLIDAGPQDAMWIQSAAKRWPHCRFLVASETVLHLPGWAISLRTSSGPSA